MSSLPCFPLLDFLVTPVVVGFERLKRITLLYDNQDFKLSCNFIKGYYIGFG